MKVLIPRLHKGQRVIHNDPSRHRVIAPGRQWGKTTYLQHEVTVAIAAGKQVGWYAPEYKRLDEPFRRVLKAIPKGLILARDLNAKRLELITGGILKGWTMEDPDCGRGSTDHLAVIDEAGLRGDVDTIWAENISPTLARHRGRAIFAGTPKGRNGFWRLAQRGLDTQNKLWSFHAARSGLNPYLPNDYEDEARRDMPDRSFRQEILGEFLEEGGEVIGNLDSLTLPGTTRIAPQEGLTYLAGLDLAKSVDWSVLSIFDSEGRQVLLERWQGVPWRETIRRAIALVEPYNAMLTVDATGVGDPIFDAIKAGWRKTKPFKFTESSREDLLDSLVLAFEQGEIRILDVPAQRAELESLEWAATRRGKLRLQVPSSMHDDIIMADALALWGRRSRRPLVIATA